MFCYVFICIRRKCVDLEQEVKNLHHQLKSYLARIDDVRELNLNMIKNESTVLLFFVS